MEIKHATTCVTNNGLPQPLKLNPWTMLEDALGLFETSFLIKREQPVTQERVEIKTPEMETHEN